MTADICTFTSDEVERLAVYTAFEQAKLEGSYSDVQRARARLRSLKLRFLREMRLQATEGALAHAKVRPSAWAARHMCKKIFDVAAAMSALVERFAEHHAIGEERRTAAERSEMDLIDEFMKTDVPAALRAELAIQTAQYEAHGQLLRMRARAALGLSAHFTGGLRPLDD